MPWHNYRVGMRFYDALSGERCVYRAGRVAGVELMGLRPGDTVLDVGCGTGLSFELLVDAVGPTGRIIGVDSSAQMVELASGRVTRNGWSNVRVVHADATTLTAEDLEGDGESVRIDAVFSAYALSVMADPDAALTKAAALLASGGRLGGGRMGVVDMQRPTGAARVFTPLARMATAFGGSDIDAHPWEWLEQRGHNLQRTSRRGGHIRVVTGTLS